MATATAATAAAMRPPAGQTVLDSGGGNENVGGGCRIIHGDALDVLSSMPDRSVRCVCTDPPYGVGVAGMEWDKAIPDAGVWKECVRTMEHGAFAFVMCSPRQDVAARMVVRLEQAGLDMSFPPVLWTFATGFSPSKSAGHIARRFGRSNGGGSGNGDGEDGGDSSSRWQGPDADGSYLGYMPRPGVELVLVGMRPPKDGTALIDQYAANGLGVTHLDDCRIPYADEADMMATTSGYYVPAGSDGSGGGGGNGDGDAGGQYGDRRLPPGAVPSRDGRQMRVPGKTDKRGRFPSNVICSGGGLDDGREHGNARGTYSRYFDLDAWAKDHLTVAITAAPKPRSAERDGGLESGTVGPMPIAGGGRCDDGADGADGRGRAVIADGGIVGNGDGGDGSDNNTGRWRPPLTPYDRSGRSRMNNHPTVKPIALFAYLMHLGSRPGDAVLDPFVGSGTAALAARMTGRRCIGIERSGRYVAIARTRVRNYAMNTRMEAFM